MGLFDFFPYTSGHTLNLDWIVKQVKGFSSALSAHVDNKNNPHEVTAEQVGGAPAGFGLGEETATYVSDVHTINKIGFYRFDGATANKPSHFPHGVISANISNGVIYLTATYAELQARTFYGSDGWNEWEYANPPMITGVEYRTTEKWQGKPVYTTIVDCGSAPDVSFKNIAFQYAVIRCSGFCDAGNGYTMSLPVNYGNSGTIVSCHHQSGNIIVYSNDNSSAYKVYTQVWYLKD